MQYAKFLEIQHAASVACINHLAMREEGHSYINKSENFALTLYVVWLLVRAVTGGAIPKAFGIMANNNNRSSVHLARTNEPEAKQNISNTFD
jgi:hypothetical protein